MEHYYKLWMFQGLPSEDVLVVFTFYPVVHYLKKFIKFWSIMITFGQMTQMEARKELLPKMSSLKYLSLKWCPLEIYQPMPPTTNIIVSHYQLH